MRLPAPRLFAGRARDLATLEAELARACAGELRIVLLAGEAGIGKTALARELVTRAGHAPLVLTARAHAYGTSTPFGLWVEALERHLRTLDPPTVRRLAGMAAPDLAPLLRSVEASDPSRPSRQASSYRLVESLVALIAAIAAHRPTVAVLDDAHLADTASWETLEFLARDRPTLPLLIVASCRPDELADDPVGHDVALALEQDGVLRRLGLEPLDRDELEELARKRSRREVVPAALVSWLQSHSRGNALFATGLLTALLDQGGDLSRPALAGVPDELGQRVRARLRDLEDDALETLELLTVVGARTELADLARLTGHTVERVAIALDVLARRRLVIGDGRGPAPTFEVAHPLVQEAVYESIGIARRTSLHRAIGRTLLAAGDLAGGATHLARSASRGDAEAVDALVAALRQAEARSLYRAVTTILGELLRLLGTDDDRWLDVLRVMDPGADWVLAHLAEDGVADAYAAMRRIEPVAERSGDDLLRAVVQLRLACFGGQGAGALRACERAAELFDRAGEPALAMLARAESAFALSVRGETDAALARTQALLASSDTSVDAQVRMHLQLHLSYQLPLLGRFEEAWEAERIGIQVAEDAGNHFRTAILRNRHRANLALGGRLHDAQASALGTWNSPAGADALANEFQILVNWLAGDLDDALRALGRARARNRTAVSQRQSRLLSIGAHAAVEADRLDGIQEFLERAVDANRNFTGAFAAHPPWALAVLSWRLGNPGALSELRAATERICALHAPVESLYFMVDLADAAVEYGSPRDAEWAAGTAEKAVKAVERIPFHAALYDLVVAIALRSAERARSAAATFEELGYILFLGRAQLALGRAHANSDRRAALAEFESAVATFGRCGAAWHVTRTLDAMRGLGPPGLRVARTHAGPSDLSAREAQVARLAATGKTAAEIAAALFIGERTVETHLRNAYAKLGVSSKRELVQRASELGLRS